MPLPSTMTPIATQTLASATATVTFSSIPQTYTDLVLVIQGSVTATNPDSYIQFNSDTGTNYSVTVLEGNGTSASSTRYSTQSKIYIDAIGTGTGQMNYIVNIQNYSNSTTYKTTLGKYTNAALGFDATVGLWRNTAAITSILITVSSSTYTAGSTFTLYGIKGAS